MRIFQYRKYRTLNTAVLRYQSCNTAPRGIAIFANAYSKNIELQRKIDDNDNNNNNNGSNNSNPLKRS